ncbi:hypothetical protein [Micromonospora sp. NPDC048063]|uniref:hypothetical protein n=1 Tax=Micromonospora sp. NPDC048063 TaxID=3364256 RepID=UPI003710E22E
MALAMVQEIQDRADRQIAELRAGADRTVGELLELGERPDEVATLLDLSPAEVRAARRRVRAAADEAAPASAAVGSGEVGLSGSDGGV